MATNTYSKVPENRPAALSKKVESLNKISQPKVKVSRQPADGTADEIIAAIKNAGITVKVIQKGNKSTLLDVIHVTSGLDSPKGKTSPN